MVISSPGYKGNTIRKIVKHQLPEDNYLKAAVLFAVVAAFVTVIRFNFLKLNKEHKLYKYIHSENGCRVMYLLWFIASVLLYRCFQLVVWHGD